MHAVHLASAVTSHIQADLSFAADIMLVVLLRRLTPASAV